MTALLPERHENRDLFFADFVDAAPRADQAGMEFPFFSLSRKKDIRERAYGNPDAYFEIVPNAKYGAANIFDRDIIIYCISQLMAAKNKGQAISSRLWINPHALLEATNRFTSGQSYRQLVDAINRLNTTQFKTNIRSESVESYETFSLVQRAKIDRCTKTGRLLNLEIELADWVMRAVESQQVLTISREYFRLRKPLERRLYELARKHCNRSKKWRIGLPKLQAKMGSTSSHKEFRRLIRSIIKADQEKPYFPDYRFEIEGDNLNVYPKAGFKEALDGTHIDQMRLVFIDSDTYEKAKEVAPKWDIYYLEEQWRGWIANTQKKPPRDPDKAFIGFCRSWFQRNGKP